MIPYFLVLSFVMIILFIEKKSFNRNGVFVISFILIMFFSLRNYTVGTDTIEYTRYAMDGSYIITDFNYNDKIEPALQWITYFLSKFSDNYFWLFIFGSLIVVPSHLYILRRYSVNYLLSVFIFITYGAYTFFFNGFRQGLAMSIVVLATPFLLNSKFWKWCAMCLFASLFHVSALFLIPWYFIVNYPLKLVYKLFISFLVSLVFSKIVIEYFASENNRYEVYAQKSEEAGGVLTFGFYLLLGFVFFIFYKKYSGENTIYEKMSTFYLSGVIFLVPIVMLNTSASGPQRLISYFTWTLALLFPVVFSKINNRVVVFLFVLFSLFYFYLTTSRFSDLSPYVINPAFEIF